MILSILPDKPKLDEAGPLPNVTSLPSAKLLDGVLADAFASLSAG
ncbi:MAG: hypothetical protein R3C56_19650 [Pirellulaceae bacterium]